MKSWHKRAACRHADPETFFTTNPRRLAEAQQLCAGCPVRAECAEEGHGEEHGVWGGIVRHRVKV